MRILSASILATLLFAALVPAPAGAVVQGNTCDNGGYQPGSCQFSCDAGDVIHLYTYSGGAGHATVSCGGASGECSTAYNCATNANTVALYADVGSCVVDTPNTLAYCGAEDALAETACTLDVAYDMCAFLCPPGALVTVEAVSTVSPGWPRVVAVCGDATVECQSFMFCSAQGVTLTAGYGMCTSRTEKTEIVCSARSPDGALAMLL